MDAVLLAVSLCRTPARIQGLPGVGQPFHGSRHRAVAIQRSQLVEQTMPLISVK